MRSTPGLTWQDAGNWVLSADYWRYSFKDVLRKENAQAIVNADPFDARIERTAAGTISIVNVAFINADRIKTSGIDLAGRANVELSGGLLTGWAEATWLVSYDVTNAGVAIDALGKLNRANVGAPNQKFRAAAGLAWSRRALQVNALARHVGGYKDDGGGSIDSFTTLDANVRWSFAGLLRDGTETSITLGAAQPVRRRPALRRHRRQLRSPLCRPARAPAVSFTGYQDLTERCPNPTRKR